MKTKSERIVLFSLIGIALSSVSCERVVPFPSRSTVSEAAVNRDQQLLISQTTPIPLTPISTIDDASLPRPHPILKTVVTVSIVNIAINVLRPDPFLPPVMRLPRILLEACIASMALVAQKESMFWLILSIMTLVTAMIDIFVWGPIFAFFTSWEQCTGGGGWWSSQPQICVTNYVMGSSRLLASIQSTLGGIFYLVVAVLSWGQFWEEQDYKRRKWQATTIQQLMHQQKVWPQPQGISSDSLV